MSITEFLLARIAEDEEVARAAQGEAIFQHQTGRWSFEAVHDEYGPIPIVFAVADGGGKTQVASLESAWEREQRGAHIARHDPARVLAECEAKRRVVELAVSWRDHADRFATGADAVSAVLEAQAITAETVLRTIARAWSDHPDYREEW